MATAKKPTKPTKPTNKDLFAEIIAEVTKKSGEGSATMFASDDVKSDVREVIPTGLQALNNHVIGCGGLPVGRGVEVYGPEGSGKSAFCYLALAQVQQLGGNAILIDTDFSSSKSRAKAYGIDTSRLLLLQPEHLDDLREQCDIVLKKLDGSVPTLMVWDQLASTASKGEIEQGLMGDAAMGERAKDLAIFYRILRGRIAEKRVCFITVNEIREKMGIKFGDKEDTPGGKAPKHFSSLRLKFSSGALIKEGGTTTGKTIGVTVYITAKKNRFGPPRNSIETRLMYDKGWDEQWTTITHAKEVGLIEKGARISGGTYQRATAALQWVNGQLVEIPAEEGETIESLEEANFESRAALPVEDEPGGDGPALDDEAEFRDLT